MEIGKFEFAVKTQVLFGRKKLNKLKVLNDWKKTFNS